MNRGSRSVASDQSTQITRRIAVSLIAAGGIFAAAGPALADVARGKYDLVPRKVGDGIWIVRGSTDYFDQDNGGDVVNCILIETASGIVIVDTGVSLRYGQALAKVASGLGGLGVAAVSNTHHHPDHWFGNLVFADRPIYALAGTKKLAETDGDAFSDNMYRLLGNWMRGTETTPPTDVPKGVKAFAILPGHGPIDLNGTSLTQTKANPTWLETALKTAAAQGLDVVEIMQDVKILGEFAALGAMPREFHRSIAHLYPDIEKKSLPLSNRG